jgi:hypothetical protein
MVADEAAQCSREKSSAVTATRRQRRHGDAAGPLRFALDWLVASPSGHGPRGAIVLTPRRGNDKIAQGRASRRSRDASPWVTKPSKMHRPEGARQDGQREVITSNFEPDVQWIAWIRGLRRAKRISHVRRDVGIRIISMLGFSRLWRICLAPSGRRTCGVGRLPRAALGGCAASLCPGLTCFAPSGLGGFSTHGRFLRGWWFFGAPPT